MMNVQHIDMKAAADRARFRLVGRLLQIVGDSGRVLGVAALTPASWTAVVSSELAALRVCYAHRHHQTVSVQADDGWRVSVEVG